MSRISWKNFNIYNRIGGLVAFVIALVTYLMTIGPTASLWDCAEFIACDYRLEVGHPPGAPFYMLVYNVITHLAPDSTQAALYANATSALLSAVTILFLFWTISFMLRRLLVLDFNRAEASRNKGLSISLSQGIIILGGSLVGALAYTFSDTFWYSAVEAEVYAFSSFFTALVVWLMFMWEERSEEEGSDRWLILIAYLMGLSIGVHLLNLLCLPAMALIYYYKKSQKPTLKGSAVAVFTSFVMIVVMMYGIIQGLPKVAGQFDLFFVNTLGFSFNTGLYAYLLLTFIILAVSVFLAHKSLAEGEVSNLLKGFSLLSVVLLGIPFIKGVYLGFFLIIALALYLVFWGNKHISPRLFYVTQMSLLSILVGFASYGVILIRAVADTPMNENAPSNAFSLRNYLAREQYGSTPLLYGQTFASRVESVEDGDKIYNKAPQDSLGVNDEYAVVGNKIEAKYRKGDEMLFPRMWSKQHSALYKSWLGRNPQNPLEYNKKPSFGENLRFFFGYQLNYMYWRYFFWNFTGRQNDLQGDESLLRGNAITGINFIDTLLLGLDMSDAPESFKKNKGHNVYYALPFLLGLLGLFFQVTRLSRKDEEEAEENMKKNKLTAKQDNFFTSRISLGSQSFAILFFLFFMTGIAIVLYLNQTPSQPRERDYAYAGSFYAYCIWIGFGVAGLWRLLDHLIKNSTLASALAVVVTMLIPLQMMSQNWDDHDRSGRTIARDMGINYLESCDDNAVLYCYGDNDTFPLWYIQDVEGVRRDIRTVNLSYAGGEWYVDQLKRATFDAKPLPLPNMKPSFYYPYEAAYKIRESNGVVSVGTAFASLLGQRGRKKAIFPYQDLYVKLDDTSALREDLRQSGDDELANRIIDLMPIHLQGKNYLDRSALLTADLLQANQFERPIYWAITSPRTLFNNLPNYCVQTGMAYQVLPINLEADSLGNKPISVRVEKMYDNVMNKFKYCGAENPNVYFDENCRNIVGGMRVSLFATLAKALSDKGDSIRAKEVLEQCLASISEEAVPYDNFSLALADECYRVGMDKEAEHIVMSVLQDAMAYLDWFFSIENKDTIITLSQQGEYHNKCKIALSAILNLKDRNSAEMKALIERFEGYLKRLGIGNEAQKKAV